MIVYISKITINVDLHSKVHYPNSDLCNVKPQGTVHLKIFLIVFWNIQASVDTVRYSLLYLKVFMRLQVTKICDKQINGECTGNN